jgi:hypothetical protein
MKTFVAFLAALPELVRLVKNIERRIEAAETERKIKEDLEAINEAFEKEDPEKLKQIFNS